MSESFIPFFKPDIGDTETRAVVETLGTGWLTSGPRTHEFEARFADFVGAEHAIAVNSCTAGLHLALAALGIGTGDEVIVPTMTFAATAEAVIHLGARPVLVDCNPETLNIDTVALAAAITSRTRAVVPVHYGGHPADMDRILEIAQSAGVPVVEDAAHAFPSKYRGRTIGTIGDITTFSFYANKTITTGEGGMVTTEHGDLADRMRMLSLHGLTNAAWGRNRKQGRWDYDIVLPGYKYNLSDIAAALGIAQLDRADHFLKARTRVAERYDAHFSQSEIFQPLSVAPDVQHSRHLYVVVLDTDRVSISRNELINILEEEGVGTSVHYRPLHLHTLYRERYGYAASDLPTASDLFDRIISLPIYPTLKDHEVDRVTETLLAAVDRHTL